MLFRTLYYSFIGAIVLLGILLISTLVSIPGNFEVKIVQSGSMEPAIKTGSIVIVKPVELYKIGDIITFGKDTRDQIPTTHRIIEMKVVGGELRFITKGDANDDRDNREVKESEIIGKVLFDVPFVGFILDMAKKPIGFAILIGVPALAIISDEIMKIWKEAKRIRNEKKLKKSGESGQSESKGDEEKKVNTNEKKL